MSHAAPAVGFVSLGCPKALVDSEQILTRLRGDGYRVVPTYAEADLVVVNTCGFIDAAVEESLEAIGEALAENGRVIVTGCLGSRAERVRATHPAVLDVTGPHADDAVMAAVRRHLPLPDSPGQLPPQGIRLTPSHYAYLKIAEGCNHRCAFCVIPALRGDLASRDPADVLDEARLLVDHGVSELLVVAQDSVAYGVDLGYRLGFWNGRPLRARLTDLVDEMAKLGAWVRLHYIYPYPQVDALVERMADGLLLPYLDVPLQHASRRVLKAMRRPGDRDRMLERILTWRETCPELTLRSTFIVGFPGETEEDFAELLEFLAAAELDRVGCFTYSPVDGAAANALPDPVPEALKLERQERLMALQSGISARRLARRVGGIEPVIVDAVEDGVATARSRGDAPEIDGQVIVADAGALRPGEIVDVRITASDTHDLHAESL
ncbi:MAG: 30S ribosomal protein S12 methylthiotransferase RimO [Gammaproteobacteria bacterium]|nr:30S ribosomal protein S12 methylthiotransferase RimO [Gammaproteobacteria bacterium]